MLPVCTGFPLPSVGEGIVHSGDSENGQAEWYRGCALFLSSFRTALLAPAHLIPAQRRKLPVVQSRRPHHTGERNVTWLKENLPVIGAMTGVVLALVAVLHLVVVVPMNARFDDLRAAMNQRFDQQDKYMNARFDAVDQRFEAVDQRLDDLRSEMNQRFDAVDRRFDDLRSEMNQRFDTVDQRFDVVERRLERLETHVSELRTFGERISRNEGRIDLLTEQLQAVPTPGR